MAPHVREGDRIEDGVDDIRHEDEAVAGIRGVAGHFERTVAAIRMLRRAGLTVQVNTVVMRDTVDELHALVETRESVLDSVPDPLLTLDQNGRIVRANLSARLLLGKQLNGRDLASVLRNPGVLDAVDRRREAVVNAGPETRGDATEPA